MIKSLMIFAKLLGVSTTQLSTFLGLIVAGVTIEPLLSMLKNANDKDKANDNDFATKDEISHLLSSDGIRVSKNISISAKNLFEHLLIFGPTGSGKSSTIFIPNLLQKESFCNSESSLVMTDLKGELYDTTHRYQRSLGRDIKVFAPFNKEMDSIHFNPLDFCEDETEVIALAKDILITGAKAIELRNGASSSSSKDTTWLNMAAPLFSALLLYVYKLPKPKNTISYALRLLINNSDDSLKKLLLTFNDDTVLLQYKMYQKAKAYGPIAASIQNTLTANVQAFLTPDIEKITSYTDFDFKDLREKRTALYIIYPPDKAFDLAPVMSIFFSQMFNKCKDYNKKNHYPLFCLFDEFANCGQIPMFNMYSSILRSYRIGLICCLQDKSQLKNIYGDSTETIFNNLRNLCVFGGEKDFQTLRSIQMLCGNTEVLNVSMTKTDKGNSSKTQSFKSQPLMPADEIKNIKEDEILIMLKNQRPILDKTNAYYKDYGYLSNIL